MMNVQCRKCTPAQYCGMFHLVLYEREWVSSWLMVSLCVCVCLHCRLLNSLPVTSWEKLWLGPMPNPLRTGQPPVFLFVFLSHVQNLLSAPFFAPFIRSRPRQNYQFTSQIILNLSTTGTMFQDTADYSSYLNLTFTELHLVEYCELISWPS